MRWWQGVQFGSRRLDATEKHGVAPVPKPPLAGANLHGLGYPLHAWPAPGTLRVHENTDGGAQQQRRTPGQPPRTRDQSGKRNHEQRREIGQLTRAVAVPAEPVLIRADEHIVAKEYGTQEDRPIPGFLSAQPMQQPNDAEDHDGSVDEQSARWAHQVANQRQWHVRSSRQPCLFRTLHL